ncbi:MAG: hypothetical protein PSX81_12475 [bacterium]|nr:hypothetical protein [bacterium]
MKTFLFKQLFAFFLLNTCINGTFAGYPKHSFMPMVGLSSAGITDYSLRVSHGLQVTYSSSDRMRTPLGIRYQYRMKKGNILGVDLMGIYSPIIITPQYLDAASGFGGPAMSIGQYMTGGNIHFSKTIDIKLIEIFGMAGFGGYFTGAGNSAKTTDYTWYKDGGAGFYDFAPTVTNNALSKFFPVVAFGCGVRLKHLEGGINNQMSLGSPVKDFTYNGYTHSVPLIWKSIGYYVGYRFEF